MADKKKKKRLIEKSEDEENGISNPIMDGEESEMQHLSGGESSIENVDETQEAESLIKDLKTKHISKQKELSKVVSPKDDLAKELRTIKKKSKEKVDETIRQEEEELSATEATEDGTIPMPTEGEEETMEARPPTESLVTFAEPEEEAEAEEDPVKKLKRKKEKVEEEEVTKFEEPPETARSEPSETAAPPTPKPEDEVKTPRGLKARMKDRLKKAKEEAAAEAEMETREEEKKERQLKRDKERKKTRFDPELDEAELERIATERSKALKSRWKKMGKPTEDRGVFMPTAEEAYDFFTHEFPPEPDEPLPKEDEEKGEGEEKAETEAKEKEEGEEGAEPDEEKEEDEEAKKEDKKKEDREDDEIPLLDDIDEEGYGFYAVRKAEYDDSPETAQKEAEKLFYPSVTSVNAEDKNQKIFKEKEPRFLEDEGFYVGTRPEISGWNQNKMENRLLKEKNYEKWFGEDGKMIVLPNPLRPSPSRPPVPEEPEPGIETQYRKAIMHEYDNRYIDGSIDNAGFYQLDVDINALSFSHHHLFSREHVLAMRLTELYEQYLVRRKKNMAEYLTEKLKALKNSAVHLKDHMLAHKSEHDYADRSNFQRRLLDYKYEIRRARALRDKEEQADRHLLKAIIKTWKELKTQRETQKYTNTPVKLQITKEEVNKEFDMSQWKMEIEDELEEMEEEAQEIYEKKNAEYQEVFKKQQEQKKAKEEAQKRIKKRGRKNSKGSKGSMGSRASKLSAEVEPNPEDDAKDQDILNEPDIELPDKPDEFNREQARQTVIAKAKEIRRRPGEAKIYPEVSNTQSITQLTACPRGEQQRRDDVDKCRIFIKVLFNNKEVSRTPAKPLTQDFKINFGQIFNLKIVQWPESITYQIHQTFGFGGEMLAELNASIPDASVTSQSVQLENLDFSSDHRVHHSHEGVGSGVPFSFGPKNVNTQTVTLMTTAELSCSVAWATDDQGQPLVPPSTQGQQNMFNAMKKMDPVSAIGATGVIDIQKLAKWFEESRLDPNDPANADLVFLLKPKGGDPSLLGPKDYFRLEQLQEEFNFCDDESIEENKRFKLIHLRDSEITEFKNYKMVPLLERDIPRDTFIEYEKKKREEEKYKEEKDIETHRAAVSKFMQRVREQVIRRFRLLAHQRRLEDVVNEEAVPNIALLGTSLLKLTERRRRLRVERKERKKVVPQTIENVKILVNINRALNLPKRLPPPRHQSQGGMTARETDKAMKNIVGETQVQPYVEVMFQDHFLQTEIGDGPNPCFNEELEMPFKAPNDDYTPANLQTVTDNIYLNLFDQVLIDIQEDDRQRETTVHQRIEKKWLGGLTIPFSTIYFNGKIEGTFKLNTPPVLLGYSTGPEDDEGGASRSHEVNTYVGVFMTIEPPLQPAEPMRERFATTEDEKLLEYAENWEKTLLERFKGREYKTSVIDVNGKTVFITRYFKPLEPPSEVLEKGDTEVKKMELVARYVSMIPSISDSVVFPGLCDIWSTCDQFLQMMAGDEEEHAVLLANYFLHMKKKTYLIIGYGIPEGPTAYVLTEQEGDFWIWNAGTGEHFSYRDSFCPLQIVSCLVNAENIWGNIQQYDKPAQMNFDVTNGSAWRPFFTRSFPNTGISSYQPERLYYKPTNKNAVLDLQEKIEQLLKNKIMEWRSRLITRWNRHCTQIMRKLLPVLEENLGRNPGEQHLQELEQSFGSYKVSGFPINMPYNEINTIVEAVFSTRVHAHETSDVEFALSVYIHPYPNDVLSVWVYVASLIRNR